MNPIKKCWAWLTDWEEPLQSAGTNLRGAAWILIILYIVACFSKDQILGPITFLKFAWSSFLSS